MVAGLGLSASDSDQQNKVVTVKAFSANTSYQEYKAHSGL